jgi:hypothetical protein
VITVVAAAVQVGTTYAAAVHQERSVGTHRAPSQAVAIGAAAGLAALLGVAECCGSDASIPMP